MPIAPRQPTPLYAALSRTILRVDAWVRSHGSRRLRWTTRAAWLLVAALGFVLLVGPVINRPLSFDDVIADASTATDQWIARSFSADYTVHRDATGRMRMDVVERIDAVFPEGVDGDGAERVILSQLEGHDLAPLVTGAEVDGEDVEPTVDRSATTTTIRLDTGETFTGAHEFVLRYTLHDVVYEEFDESTQLLTESFRWDVFGPSWPHGVAQSELSVTVPVGLADRFARVPSSGMAWLLLSDATTLAPDAETAESVTFRVSNDQNMPPHAQFWFTLDFVPGTFAMPPPSFLYLVQLVGPFVPLVLLAVAVLFAMAARAVAWGDARGRSWFVGQHQPDADVSPDLAARLWRAVTTSPLVAAIARFQQAPGDARARSGLVRAASRTGRLGGLPGAWRTYLGPPWQEQFTRGLRRVPRGFVRDSFIGAALALTVLQWGLVRQLSYQVPLSRYWWPVAIVIATMLLAAVVLALALSARPLTRRGAVAREHLMGLELYVERTRGAERSSLSDPLLPYAVMFSPARRARRLVRGLLRDEGVADQVREGPDFVTGPRLAVRAASVLTVVVAIALGAWVPMDLRGAPTDAVYEGDLPGDYGVFVHDFDVEAALAPGPEGRVVLTAEERLDVVVGANYREVPQVLRQWRDRVDGHDMRFTVTSVTVDGSDVPFDVGRLQGKALLQTRIPDEWPGEHEIVIRYEMADAVGSVSVDGDWRDQLRWTALDEGWDFAWTSPDDDVERIGIALRVPVEIARVSTGASGWLAGRYDEGGVRPFDSAEATAGEIVYREELLADEDGYWGTVAYNDLGVQLQFPDGTFGAPRHATWILTTVMGAVPLVLPTIYAVLASGLAVLGLILRRVAPARVSGGLLRDVVRWVPAGLTAAQLVTWLVISVEAAADHPLLSGIGIPMLISAGLSVWVLVATRRPALAKTKTTRRAADRRNAQN